MTEVPSPVRGPNVGVSLLDLGQLRLEIIAVRFHLRSERTVAQQPVQQDQAGGPPLPMDRQKRRSSRGVLQDEVPQPEVGAALPIVSHGRWVQYRLCLTQRLEHTAPILLRHILAIP